MGERDVVEEARLDETLGALHRRARTADGSLDVARERVLAAARAEAASLPAPRPPRPPRTPSRRWLPALAAAAVLVAAVLLPLSTSWWSGPAAPGTSTAPTMPSAASAHDLLQSAAAATAPEQVLRPGEYREVTEHVWAAEHVTTGDRTGYSYLLEHRNELWIPWDADRAWKHREQTIGGPTWLGGTDDPSVLDGARTSSAAANGPPAACVVFAGASESCEKEPRTWRDPAFYAGLPRQAEPLLARLHALSGQRGDGEDPVSTAAALLGTGMVQADLRAALYRALAELPGMRLTDRSVTLDGRTGVAFGLDGERWRHAVILDPATGEFLGSRTTTGDRPAEPWLTPGTVVRLSSVTMRVVDDSTGTHKPPTTG